jgi:uridine kinase
VAEVIAAVTDALGRVRHPLVVLVDGPSGAGKTTLADALIAHWPGGVPPTLVRMDDLYPGWHGLAAAAEQVTTRLLQPLRSGRAGRWQRYDWEDDRPPDWYEVQPGAPLVVEGCGTLRAANVPLADVRVWLDADDVLRKERALARDGAVFASHWDLWQRDWEAWCGRELPGRQATIRLRVPFRGYRGAMSPESNTAQNLAAQNLAAQYIAEFIDGPLEGDTEKRALVDGKQEPQITMMALVDGLESMFWYYEVDVRDVQGELHARYSFNAPESDPSVSDDDQKLDAV